MPSGSVSPVTRPKSVSTPTLPVGMDVVLHRIKRSTTIASPICRMREPASRIFGNCRTEPPKSLPPPVTFAMDCLHRAACRSQRRAHRLYHLLRAANFLLSHGGWHRISQLPCATGPLYIVVFPLDSTATLRQNRRQHSSVTWGIR